MTPKKGSPRKPKKRKPAAAPQRGAAQPRGGATLADRIAIAPQLVEPKAARARVAEWLAGLSADTAKLLKGLLAAHRTVNTLLESLSESSPYLWDLASREPERLIRLMGADPDRHLAALLSDNGRAIAAAADDAEAMRLLRRMKAEAALLIALADIGGVWPVMRAARALTDLADTAVDAASRFLLAEAARAGRLNLKDKAQPQAGSGYIVVAMGKMGAFELNYSSDIDLIVFYDPAAQIVPPGAEPAPLFVKLTQRLVKLLQERTADGYVFRTDLRLRPDPASTAIAISTAGGDVLLRKRRAELGARRHDQGARLRRRYRSGRGSAQRIGAVCMAQISRLRRARRRARHEAADQRLSRPWRDRGRGPQYQARARRHPRNRVLRADPAVDRRRPQSAFARPRHAHHPRQAQRGSLDRQGRLRGHEGRVLLSARGRAPAADGQ